MSSITRLLVEELPRINRKRPREERAYPHRVMHDKLMVRPGRRVRLKDFDPDDTCGYKDKKDAAGKLEADSMRLRQQQDLLYASKTYALLIILQGMDTAGKDGVISHVMSGLNPQGVDVHPFKEPSEEELNHDFLWRCFKVLPERGRIGIFNRSYYEEVLVTRVKPAILKRERLPVSHPSKSFWQQRFNDITHFEQYLVRNCTFVLKFFLHISKTEQRKRLLDRIETPNKHWKFSPNDLDTNKHWKQYQEAYQEMLSATSPAEAPWYVIPANHKWAARVAVADVIGSKLVGLKMKYPQPGAEQRRGIKAARQYLEDE